MRISGEFVLRLLTSIVLLSFAAFSVFGFLASFEGGKYNVYHLVYGAGRLACLSAATLLIRGSTACKRHKLFFVTAALFALAFVVFICGAFGNFW